MHVEKHELGRDGGIPSVVGALAEEVVEGLLARYCYHDLVHLGDDAVLAEGAHGEDDLILVVLHEQYGLLTHAVSPSIVPPDGRAYTRQRTEKNYAPGVNAGGASNCLRRTLGSGSRSSPRPSLRSRRRGILRL